MSMYNDAENTQYDIVSPALPRDAASAAGMPVTRRTFLLTTAVLGALAVSGAPALMRPVFAADAAPADVTSFMRVSAFVTGKNTLDAAIGQRFLSGLAKRDSAFGTQISALLSYIDSQKLTDMDAFLAAPGVDPAVKATATKIVSAWYLGIIGDGADSELITYADALMYAPTKGVLAVPTYGPGPLAWGDKPADIVSSSVGSAPSAAPAASKA